MALARPALITVVMPVLDGEAHVAEQLGALSAQDYTGAWEIVVVDNGCTDGTVEIVNSWRDRLPLLRVADARDRQGLNRARNAGVGAARGDFIAFCDADDVAAPGWLTAMADASDGADLVGGRLEWELLNDPVVRAWRPQAPMTGLLADHGFLRYAPGGNMGVWTSVAREIGWDERFRFGSSDHGFAWHAQLAGYRLAFASGALVQQRFRPTLRALARQQFHYGLSGPRLQRDFRPLGMPAPDNRAALRHWRRLATSVPDLWGPREARGRWVKLACFRAGRIAGSVRARVLCL